MSGDDVELTTPLDVAQAENELLRLELAHLRGRLGAEERLLERAERAEAELERLRPYAEGLRERVHELEIARRDLVWLLRRLQTSPFAIALRSRAGFRDLVARHLGGDRGEQP